MTFATIKATRAWLAGLLLAGSLLAAVQVAQAQDAPTTRLRGTITATTGDGMTIETRNGAAVEVTLGADTMVRAITLAEVSEIQPGRYIGTTAVPQADGTLKALEVHVFPPEMAGAGDGHRPWDLAPGSTMTNGMVGELTASQGRTITVKYKDGEQTVVIPDDVPIVNIEAGDRSLLVPGAQVVLFARENADGTLTALAILAGKDGVTPPM